MPNPQILSQLGSLHGLLRDLLNEEPDDTTPIPGLGTLGWHLGRCVFRGLYWLREVVDGDADLTSHVDFGALARAARAAGASALPLMTQGEFLLANGLLERAGQLGAGKDSLTQDAIRQAVNRLAGDGEGQMGSLFKVFCATGKGIQNPLAPFS